MSTKRSKRRTKIPIRFEDSVCELNKKKNKQKDVDDEFADKGLRSRDEVNNVVCDGATKGNIGGCGVDVGIGKEGHGEGTNSMEGVCENAQGKIYTVNNTLSKANEVNGEKDDVNIHVNTANKNVNNSQESEHNEYVASYANMAITCQSLVVQKWDIEGVNNKPLVVQKWDIDEIIHNKGLERRDLWNELMGQKSITTGYPWLVMGDMNVTLNTNEHTMGGSYLTADMEEFADCVNKVELTDLCSSGLFFTWSKNPNSVVPRIMKKLDRIMVNEEFLKSFSDAHAIFLPYLTSDHSPGMVVVSNGWNKEISGCKMFKLVKKLKYLKPSMNELSWKNGNIFDRVEKMRNMVKEKQRLLDLNPHNSTIKEAMVMTLQDYHEAISDEEIFLFQKAKIEWLSAGDQNTAFFHKMIKCRVNKNKIEAVCDVMGNRYEGTEIAEQFVKHFKLFLGIEHVVKSLDLSSELFSKRLSEEESNWMVRGVTNEEVKEAMFSIGDSRAMFSIGDSAFFKKAWHIVGDDVCNAIREFFSNGKMLGEISATVISLIPKTTTPNMVTDFRPISCCNVIYKCLSKVITNRLKDALKKLVNENQSAFIPGRQIQDNIMLTQELLRGYNQKVGTKRVALKIDIQKAYDTVNWGFLEESLKQFGFHELMVKWIMKCVLSAQYSINVNGEKYGYFKGARGLRQGDPISPYLFTLVMEVFTLMMERRIKMHPKFKFHKGCKGIRLTHLCFADDLLVLCNGDVRSVRVLKEALDEFSETSGLLPNPIKYLGVPLITRSLSIKQCKSLTDKMVKRVNDWRKKGLSFAGRLQLISAVLSSIQVYWSSVFLIPQTIIEEINKILKGFLWRQGELTKGKAKIAWANVCKPKKEGGLGIKNLAVWNKAMLAKHIWNIAVKKDSLWVKWIHSVRLNENSIWTVQAKIDRGITVNEMIDEGRWKWPQDWRQKYPTVFNLNVPSLIEGKKDRIVWENSKGKGIKFSVKGVWEDLCDEQAVIIWHKMVWFSQCIPKHAFILWVAMQRRLSTQDRLLQWQPNKKKMNVDSLPSVEVLNQVRWNNSIWSVVKRLCVGALVYYIWQERNAKHFKNETRSGECVQGLIEEIVKMRLMSLTVKDSKAINKVEEIWGIKFMRKAVLIYRMMPLMDANPRLFCEVVAAEWLKNAFMKEM
ncbi:RNA-directed DNA polymerase, eukaryota, reverse transcriptase zinc-binding domain protein [Tanacetum coccineum]